MAEKIKPLSSESLKRIKDNIESSYIGFKENYDRFNTFRRYIYETTIDSNKEAALSATGRPKVEFNILEAYISRLLGEFALHEPSISVHANDQIPVPHEVIDIVDGYLHQLIFEANKDSFAYEIYQSMLSGGFAVAKVWTEYKNAMSMKQTIRLGNCDDPTYCGFDPMARKPHKGDGAYSFELYPMTLDMFKEKYPNADITNLKYSKSIGGFTWSYVTDKEDKFLLLAEYYEKKRKRTQIVELADNNVMTVKRYEKMLESWDKYAQPPVVLKKRWTVLDIICRYVLIEDQILEYEQTDWNYLPHIFMGNSITLKGDSDSGAGTSYQMTRPYVYQARGIQDLKNYAGQTLANSLKNMVQHKFIVKKEALPQDQKYLDALNNIQQASTIVVQAYSENNPDQPIQDPIREIALVPAPPEVMGAFSASDPTTQVILGSFASNLGQNDRDLSGKAVIESASVNNAAAMPFVTSYLQGLSHACNIIVDLIPKYIVGKSIVPVMNQSGDTEYKKVNDDINPRLIYNQNALQVNVEAGVSFQTQKSQALQQIVALMGISKQFNAFMNSPQGLPILVENLTIYGAEQLQEAIPEWQQQQQQQQQQQMQMQQQMLAQSPQGKAAEAAVMRAQADAMKIQIDKEKSDAETQIKVAQLGIDQQRADNESILVESKVQHADVEAAMTRERAEAEIVSHALDAASKIADHHRRHDRDDTKLVHDIIKGSKNE